MDYKIYPLAYTQVDWRVFIDLCQNTLGYSPSRGVDKSYLDIKDPAAYIGSLNLENDPLKALREGGSIFQHFSMTFIADIDEAALLSLQRRSRLIAFSKEYKRDRYLTILTGNMEQWLTSIVEACSRDTEYHYRWIMSRVLEYLQQTGLKEIFSSYTKEDLQDETCILT